MEGCSQKKETVFSSLDAQGRIIEKWGNENSWDNDVNFRYFFEYDSLGRLQTEKLYHLEDSNDSFLIVDSLDFIRVEYEYDSENRKAFERRFFPIKDYLTDKVTGYKLGYVLNCKSGQEETVD
jgi:hypothetical protein